MLLYSLPEIAQIRGRLRENYLWLCYLWMPFLLPLKGEVAIVAGAFERGADLAQGHIAFIQQTIGPGVGVVQTAVLEVDIGDGVSQRSQRLPGRLANAIGVVSIPQHF